jgi:glucose/arabinose dehydrogenase
MEKATQFSMAGAIITRRPSGKMGCCSPRLLLAITAGAVTAGLVTCLLLLAPSAGLAQGASDAIGELLEGKAALGDWRSDAPLVRRKITELPPPYATRSAANPPRVVARPASAAPKVPPGFQVELFAANLRDPRVLRVAPNGDIFVAESEPGRIRVLRAADGEGKPSSDDVFASGLVEPFGIAFYPPGADPQWVYVANTGSVVRYPYRSGDLKARGKAEVIVRDLAGAGGRAVQRGHITRDIVFSKDGRQMFVSVGSASNAGEGMGKRDAAAIARWEAQHGLGSAWGNETDRAAVLVFDPEGGNRRVFASGLRNCVGLAVNPQNGDLWCSTNERDDLGDDLVPDFMTRVRDGAFYGWPWYYLGANEDPAPPRREAGPQGQDHRARCADPGALRLDGHGHLRRRPVPLRIRRRCIRRAARLLEPGRSAPATKWCACGSRTASRAANTRTS